MALNVESLEERLVPTTISLNASGDLFIESLGNANDKLQIQADVANGKMSISDPNEFLTTNIAGASGSGTNSVQIPFSSFRTAKQLIVNTFGGNDFVKLSAVGNLTLSPVIDAGDGNDVIEVIGNVMAANGDITLIGDTIAILNNARIVNAGTGNIHFEADQSITLQNGSRLESNGGNILLDANQAVGGPTSGNFVGIQLIGATIVASPNGASGATGNITLKGRGGDAAGGQQIGVLLDMGGGIPSIPSTITGGSNTLLKIIGTGGASSGSENNGVFVKNGSTITSNGGDVSVTGFGGNGADYNVGVWIQSGGEISAGGVGKLNVQGTGGGTTDHDFGVYVQNVGSKILSNGGDVTVTGIGSATASDTNYGVYAEFGGLISAGGNGRVNVSGTGQGLGGGNFGVRLGYGSTINSNNGSVQVNGFGSSVGTTGGNYGISVDGASMISAGGINSTVTVNGTGGGSIGSASGGGEVGVELEGNSQIRSSGGDVTVVGNGGGQGMSGNNYGVWLHPSGGVITAPGAGKVNVIGNGGTSGGPFNHGLLWEGNGSDITSGGGSVNVTGNTTAGSDNFAIAVYRDNVVLDPATTFWSGGFGTVLIRPQTAGTPIDVGGVDVSGPPGSATLGLTDAELDQITAEQIMLGDPMSGVMTVSSAITQASHLSLVSGAGITINQPITLDPNRNLFAQVVGSGASRFATVNADLAVSGIGMMSLSSTNLQTAGGSSLTTAGGPIALTANRMVLDGTADAGSGMIQLFAATAANSIDLGAMVDNSAGPLALSDAELDNLTAGTISIGNDKGGEIVISAAIDRAAATHLFLATSQDSNITFSATGLLNANGGDVSLLIGNLGQTDGTGAIVAGANKPQIIGKLVSLGAKSGGIGDKTTALTFNANSLRTRTEGNGNQFLREFDSVTLAAEGLTAGSGTITLAGGSFTLGGSNRISDATDLALANDATLDLGQNNELIDQLRLVRGTITGNGTLTGKSTFDLRSGSISTNLAGNVGLTKTVDATVTLSGDNNSYTGPTIVTVGTLALVSTTTNNTISSSSNITLDFDGALDVTGLDTTPTADTLILAPGQTLQGIGNLTGKLIAQAGSTVSPGNSPGILSTGSVNLQAGSAFNVEINGNVAGTGYDQLNVTGTVTLGGATLFLSGTIGSTLGQQIVIINNDGTDPVAGFFNNSGGVLLPEGASVSINGVKFILSYAGGAGGNDVTLTQAGGTLTFSNDNSAVDLWTVRVVGSNTQVLDGAEIVDSRPQSTVAGIIINGEDTQDDTLIVDFAGGNPLPAGDVVFNGGENGALDNDTLIATGYLIDPIGDGVADVTVNHTSTQAGNVVFSGLGTLRFTQLEPVSLFGTAADLVINLPAGSNTATVLEDDGGAADSDAMNDANVTAIGDATFEYTQFRNPTNSLTINLGPDNDAITIRALDVAFAPTSGTTIQGGAGNDSFFNTASNALAGNIVLLGGGGNDRFAIDAKLTGHLDGGPNGSPGDTLQGSMIDNLMLVSSNADGFLGTEPDISGGFDGIDVFNGSTPPDVDTHVNSIPEGTLNGSRVGITLFATDPQGDAVYYLLTDDAGGRFAIDPFTGIVTVKNGRLLDFIVATQHTIKAVAVDAAGNTLLQTPFIIDLTQVSIDALPLASILPAQASVVEGDTERTFVSFIVKLNKPSTQTITIDFATRLGDDPTFQRPDGISADAPFATDLPGPWDFFKTSGRLTFDPGVTEQPLRVQIRPDDSPEDNELFFVQLQSPVNANLAPQQSVGTAEILDDDSGPQLIISNTQILEGDLAGQHELLFTVQMIGDLPSSTDSATADFLTGNSAIDTAVAGSDYSAISGTLTFTNLDRIEVVRIPILGDTADGSDKTVSVRLDNPSVNLRLTQADAIGTIINDDSPNVVVSIAPLDAMPREGNSGTQLVPFVITLIGKPTADVTVNYATVGGTATAGSDYIATSGSVTFTLADIASGDIQKVISVTVRGDTIVEPNETLNVALSLPSSPGNVSINPDLAVGRVVIRNDDQAILTEDGDAVFEELSRELLAIFNAGGGLKSNPVLLAAMQTHAVQIIQTFHLMKAIVIILDPVDFVLTDSSGRQAGYTEGTGVVNQIPGAYYSGDGAVELLIVPLPPDGIYNVQLAGLGSDYNVSTTVLDNNGTSTQFNSQNLADGATSSFAFEVGGIRAIPVGQGLAANSGSASTFGVVGLFNQFGLRLALANTQEDGELNGVDLDNSKERTFELMSWLVSTVRVARRQLLEPLWQSLESPLGSLLASGLPLPTDIPPKVVDQFWSQIGQTLTGVPSGIYRLGNMLESLLPTLNPSRNRSTTPRTGEQRQPKSAPTTPGVKAKRTSLERPRATPTPSPTGRGSSQTSPPATKDNVSQAENLQPGRQ